MFRDTPRPEASSDEDFQDAILVHVSRTFALTIPQLPTALRRAVTTAYLLCRIADTIEDEPALGPEEKLGYLKAFSDAVAGREDPSELAARITPRLSEASSAHERELVSRLDRVIGAAQRLGTAEQEAIARCIEIMCAGMHHFQRHASLQGLRWLSDLDSYCYHVAGVVGEMLTDLFCASSPVIAQRGAALRRLAPSFGQGLQMTNILKDIWEDRRRGACWLPQEIFDRRGFSLDRLAVRHEEQGFSDSLQELIGIAHGHLRHALAFTLLIPPDETGIRRFCAWSIGLALLTLRSIRDNPYFTAGEEVKISRGEVMMVTICSNLTVRSDRMLTRLFESAAKGLPLVAQPGARGSFELYASLWRRSEPEWDTSARSVHPS